VVDAAAIDEGGSTPAAAVADERVHAVLFGQAEAGVEPVRRGIMACISSVHAAAT
jgi:hypothetical protein